MIYGIDKFIGTATHYQSKKIALVTNHASFTADGYPITIALLKAGFNIVKIFSPEHGITAQDEDGKEQKSATDYLTGLPVVSLYGNHFSPQENDMEDVDIVLFDLPNIGSRFYTYLWTLSYVLEACALYQKKLIVLDRPNLLGGNISMAEGPMLNEKEFGSFIGRWNMPIRFQLTYGEMANYWNITKSINASLEIIKVEGLERTSVNHQRDSTFIPTSPSMPSIQTVFLYPGMCLLEGVNVNDGRGTAMPFQVFGAPWIKSLALSEALKSLHLPGVQFLPYSYIPVWGRYQQHVCNGVYASVLDETIFKPVQTGLSVLHLLAQLYPDKFAAATYPTFANPYGEKHLEKLTGVADIWRVLQLNDGDFKIELEQMLFTKTWEIAVKDFLLYD